MRKRFIATTSLLVGVALAASGCSKVESTTTAGNGGGDVIKIGVFEPLTGANAGGGAMERQGAQLANKLYPEVNGKKIVLVDADNKSDKVEAANAAKRLVNQEKVTAVIGSWGSGLSMSAGPVFDAAKIPAVAASATNPQVTLNSKFYFRVCFIDPFQGQVLAKLAFNDLKAKKVAIVMEQSSDYSVGLVNFFEEEFVKLTGDKGSIVQKVSYNTGDTDFTAQVTAIKSANPDVIFAPGNFTESALVMKQAREQGVTAKFLGGDTWETPEFLTTGGAQVEGAIITTFFQTEKPINSKSQQFIDEYKKAYNEEPSAVAALAFDAYLVIRDAIEKTGSTDGQKIHDHIASLKNFEGATGAITINGTRDAVKDVVIKEVKGGKFVYMTTVKGS